VIGFLVLVLVTREDESRVAPLFVTTAIRGQGGAGADAAKCKVASRVAVTTDASGRWGKCNFVKLISCFSI